MTKKRLNKTETANKILIAVNSSVAYNMNMKKFNKKKDNADFLLNACEFVRCEPVYYNN
jgi:hypothetical protein